MNEIQHLIDGHTVAGSSGDTGPVFDPASGEQTAKVALASAAEVDAAVASAKAEGEVAGQRGRRLSISRH